MAGFSKSILLTISLLLILEIRTSFSTKCYNCGGPIGKGLACEIDVGKEAQLECLGENTVCHKHILKTPDEQILHRNCAVSGVCAKLKAEHEHNPAISVEDCLECEEPLCNSANYHFIAFPAFIMSLLTIIHCTVL